MKVIGVHLDDDSTVSLERGRSELESRIARAGWQGTYETKLIRAYDPVERKTVLRLDAFFEESLS